MNRDARIRRLPLALAIGLRLHEAGAAHALIAMGLGIEPEGVPPLLELARAKLERLEAAGPNEDPAGPEPFDPADPADPANSSHPRPAPDQSRSARSSVSAYSGASARTVSMVSASAAGLSSR
jgi:hypothetical protein